MRKTVSIILCLALFFQQAGFAQIVSQFSAAVPANFSPPVLKYLSLNPANPNNYFNFLIDKNETPSTYEVDTGVHLVGGEAGYSREAKKLINYFFLGLALPGEAFWVNLQPDQEDKLTSPELAKTDLGKVLLEQDLKLKKDMANYLSPRNPSGKEFWEKLYARMEEVSLRDLQGRSNLSKLNIQTNNRVWIVPEKAVVVETEDGALITEAKLKVMLESEYFEHFRGGGDSLEVDKVENGQVKQISESLMKEIIIPSITKDVNESAGYAPLRQIYHSLILAQWYKRQHPKNLFNSLSSSNSLDSLNSAVSWSKDAIYQDYLKSYTQGEYKFIDKAVFNLKRMYFSGGIIIGDMYAGSSPIIEIISKDEEMEKGADLSSSLPLVVAGSPIKGDVETKVIAPLNNIKEELKSVNSSMPNIIIEENKWNDYLGEYYGAYSFSEKKQEEREYLKLKVEKAAEKFGQILYSKYSRGTLLYRGLVLTIAELGYLVKNGIDQDEKSSQTFTFDPEVAARYTIKTGWRSPSRSTELLMVVVVFEKKGRLAEIKYNPDEPFGRDVEFGKDWYGFELYGGHIDPPSQVWAYNRKSEKYENVIDKINKPLISRDDESGKMRSIFSPLNKEIEEKLSSSPVLRKEKSISVLARHFLNKGSWEEMMFPRKSFNEIINGPVTLGNILDKPPGIEEIKRLRELFFEVHIAKKRIDKEEKWIMNIGDEKSVVIPQFNSKVSIHNHPGDEYTVPSVDDIAAANIDSGLNVIAAKRGITKFKLTGNKPGDSLMFKLASVFIASCKESGWKIDMSAFMEENKDLFSQLRAGGLEIEFKYWDNVTPDDLGIVSSPVEISKGGIDLNNIDLTLKDEKFISNLNPADYKILLATKALKEGSNPLSLLRLHEAMGLLRNDIVKSIRNKVMSR